MLKFVHNTLLSEQLKSAITNAQAIARKNRNPEFTPAHLLKGLLHKDVELISILTGLGKDISYLHNWADAKIVTCVNVSSLPAIAGDRLITDVLYEANQIRIQLFSDTIAPLYVLAALSTPGVGFTCDQLLTFPLKRDELLELIIQKFDRKPLLVKGDEPI